MLQLNSELERKKRRKNKKKKKKQKSFPVAEKGNEEMRNTHRTERAE